MTRELPLTWILGSSRSGSTWLLRMLCEFEEVAGIDDPHLGHHLGVWRPIPLAWAAADGDPELTTLGALKRSDDDYFFSDRYAAAWRPALRDLVVTRFTAQARSSPEATRIVVKEPGSQAAELLLSLFPRSNLIFLVRDGRDVVDSWLDAYRAGSWAERKGAFPVAASGRLALIRWLGSVWRYRMDAVGRAYAKHDPRRRLVVRYESLLERPSRELARVAELIGLPGKAAQLERIAARHEFGAVGQDARGPGKEVRAARPGGWRHNLAPHERRALHELIGSKLVELGYEAEPAGTRAAA